MPDPRIRRTQYPLTRDAVALDAIDSAYELLTDEYVRVATYNAKTLEVGHVREVPFAQAVAWLKRGRVALRLGREARVLGFGVAVQHWNRQLRDDGVYVMLATRDAERERERISGVTS